MSRTQKLCFARSACAVILVCVAAVSSASAGMFAHEPFDYTTGSLGSTSNGGLGWGGAWTGSALVATPGLRYTDSQGLNLVTEGNTGQTVSNAFRVFDLTSGSPAELAGVVDSGKIGAANTSVWLSFVGQYVDGASTWGGISLYNDTTENFYLGGTVSGGNRIWRVNPKESGSGTVTLDPNVATLDPALFVARLDFIDGIGDTVTAWLNPDLKATPLDVDADYSHTWSLADFKFTQVRLGGYSTAQQQYDEIRFGTTFSDVAPVPEPGALVLLIAGLVGLIGLRRRR